MIGNQLSLIEAGIHPASKYDLFNSPLKGEKKIDLPD
jgi:hypothetical protein